MVLIFRFVFRSLYRFRAFNGDPHPGDYLFHGDGKVKFLDFGLIKRINLGLYAILGQLGCGGNFRRISEELWPMTSGPPSTPMGEAEAAWLTH